MLFSAKTKRLTTKYYLNDEHTQKKKKNYILRYRRL